MFAKTIVCVIGMKNADDDLHKAASLAQEMDAHLSVLAIGIAPTPSVGDYPLGTVTLDRRDMETAAVGEQEKAAYALCEKAGIRFDVASLYVEKAWADDEIAERARYTDLVVVGDSVLKDEELKRQAVNGSLFASERPVMVMGSRSRPTLKPKTVLLAWDSSAEAARAAYDMRALMRGAEAVHVTLVDPVAAWRRNGEEPGADIAAYLAHQGAQVTVDRLVSAGRPVAEVLMQHADDIGADLVVMGAYHHSRLRERLLGGVTHTMLDDPAVPVLMSR